MFYRQNTQPLPRKPLKPRALWWWEIKFYQILQWIVGTYAFLIVVLNFCFEQFWKKESVPGEYETNCSFGVHELRCQALMKESAKLLAVFANPDAVRHREQTIAMYTQQRDLIRQKLTAWYVPWLEWLFPRSLHAHDCRWARKKMQLFDKLIYDMGNTPVQKLRARRDRLVQQIAAAREQGVSNADWEGELKQCEEWLATEEDCALEWYDRYSGMQERSFSENIPDWFYDAQQRSNEIEEIKFLMSDRKDLEAHDGRKWKETTRSLVHPNHQLWLGRKLMYSYQGPFIEGHIHLVMWFDPIKYAFMYTTKFKTRPVDYRILQAAAIKYVLTFRCLDFFVDDDYFSFMKHSIHPEIRNYFIQKDQYLKPKKRVRMPDGTHQWMLEEDFKNQLLSRQGFPDPSKYYIVDHYKSSEIEQMAQQQFDERQQQQQQDSQSQALVVLTQEEIDEYYMSQITVYEKPSENPNSVAKNGPRIRHLRAVIPDFETKVRLRFEQVVNENEEPYELSYHKETNDPYFTNAEFEMHVIQYHGPNSRYPINRTGKMLLETDPTLNGLSNSQRMIEFSYENADPSTIVEMGMQRIEQAKEEAKRLCAATNRDPNDFGMFLGKVRIDEKSMTNCDAVEKLRITYEIDQMIRSGTEVPDLILQLENLPATIPMQMIRDRSTPMLEETTKRLTNGPITQMTITNRNPRKGTMLLDLLEHGNQHSSYLEVHGYELMSSEEEKTALEDKLVKMRQDCIVNRLNEYRNTEYMSNQIQQNVAMMQSGRYIDKKKEAKRFQRCKQSDNFVHQSVKRLTYAEYVKEAKETMQERLRLQWFAKEEARRIANGKEVEEDEDSSSDDEDEDSSDDDSSSYDSSSSSSSSSTN